ncbi:MAG: hypothetical protein RL722_2995, partial [Pseudomonadota bacterium]
MQISDPFPGAVPSTGSARPPWPAGVSPRSQPRSDQHDRLTGLLDRRSLLQRMGEALAADEPVVLLHLALDRFRRVNQALGSASGDLALCRIASQLRAWAQDELPLARWGGDEFMFLLVGDIANHEAAEHLARHCIEDCARPLCLDGRWLSLSASVGLASSQTSRDGPGPAAWPCPLHQLVNAAEDALLRAKRRGGDCCLWATDADLS